MGISIWKLLLTLSIVILVFGTRKLKDVGSDLAGAITNFRKSVKEEEFQEPPSIAHKEQETVAKNHVTINKQHTS